MKLVVSIENDQHHFRRRAEFGGHSSVGRIYPGPRTFAQASLFEKVVANLTTWTSLRVSEACWFCSRPICPCARRWAEKRRQTKLCRAQISHASASVFMCRSHGGRALPARTAPAPGFRVGRHVEQRPTECLCCRRQ